MVAMSRWRGARGRFRAPEGWRGVLLVLAPFGGADRFVSVWIEHSVSDEGEAAHFVVTST